MAHYRIWYVGKDVNGKIGEDILGYEYNGIDPSVYNPYDHGSLEMKLGYDYAIEFDGLCDLNGNHTNNLKKSEIDWNGYNLFPSEVIIERNYPNGNYQLVSEDSGTQYAQTAFDYQSIDDIKCLVNDDETITCFDIHI